ncbi:MAG: endonuclease III domain-containing protein [Candidatus Omnitrophica bacterium]|nr:endonuclease III domain-containing protein [Candidatus Omnitrophota bacterium]
MRHEVKKRTRVGLRIDKMYGVLEGHFGNLKWWPAKSCFEVIIGAILTQNTAWANVEKAVKTLSAEKLLDPYKILKTSDSRLEGYIRSAGYNKTKVRRLKNVSRFIINECDGEISRLKREDINTIRKKLLEVKGIGPETADSVLLYVLGKPVFIASAYARRIFFRHNLVDENITYRDLQDLVFENFPRSRKKLNQFHALIVETGKNFCKKKKPLCAECPLKSL